MTQPEIKVSKKTLICLLAFGILFALILAEFCSRLAVYYLEGHGNSVSELLNKSSQEDLSGKQNFSNLRGLIQPSAIKDMVYELKPNLKGTFLGAAYKSNSFGMRDQEYTPEKPPGTIRIAGIGDSVIFGWGVEEKDTYLSVLEQKFNSAVNQTKKLEALNFGIPGYNTAMQLALFENKALAFDPDLIVLHVVNNDLDVPLFMLRPQNIFALDKSFLLNFITSPDKSGLVRISKNMNSEILEEYRHLSGQAAYVKALKKLAAISEQKNIPVIVIHGLLSKQMLKPLRKLSNKSHFQLIDVKPFIDDILIRKKVASDKKSRAAAIQISKTDSHPNALGHSAYAAALYENIDFNKLAQSKLTQK